MRRGWGREWRVRKRERKTARMSEGGRWWTDDDDRGQNERVTGMSTEREKEREQRTEERKERKNKKRDEGKSNECGSWICHPLLLLLLFSLCLDGGERSLLCLRILPLSSHGSSGR